MMMSPGGMPMQPPMQPPMPPPAPMPMGGPAPMPMPQVPPGTSAPMTPPDPRMLALLSMSQGQPQGPLPPMPQQQAMSENLTSAPNSLGAMLAGGQPQISGNPNNNPKVPDNTLSTDTPNGDPVLKRSSGGKAPKIGKSAKMNASVNSWLTKMMAPGGM